MSEGNKDFVPMPWESVDPNLVANVKDLHHANRALQGKLCGEFMDESKNPWLIFMRTRATGTEYQDLADKWLLVTTRGFHYLQLNFPVRYGINLAEVIDGLIESSMRNYEQPRFSSDGEVRRFFSACIRGTDLFLTLKGPELQDPSLSLGSSRLMITGLEPGYPNHNTEILSSWESKLHFMRVDYPKQINVTSAEDQPAEIFLSISKNIERAKKAIKAESEPKPISNQEKQRKIASDVKGLLTNF